MSDSRDDASSSVTSLLRSTSIDGNDVTHSTQSAAPGQFHNMNIVVAGCSTDIGQAICHSLAAAGANLALTDASKGAGQALCQSLQRSGHTGSLLFAAADPSDGELLATFIRGVSKTLKRIDGFINCAMPPGDEELLHRAKVSEMSSILDGIAKSAWSATKAIITQFETQNDAKLSHPRGGYSIINITSTYDSNEHYSNYSMARHAILGLTRSVAFEYAAADIRCNMISAGAMEEPDGAGGFLNSVFTSIAQIKDKIPMRRLAKPEEIASSALFLLSPASSYITGIDLPVDGGLSAKRA